MACDLLFFTEENGTSLAHVHQSSRFKPHVCAHAPASVCLCVPGKLLKDGMMLLQSLTSGVWVWEDPLLLILCPVILF